MTNESNSTRQVPLVKQELPTLLEHPSSSPVSSGVCVAQFVVFCVVFCRSLFVHLSFYCLSFYDYHFGTSNFQKVLASCDLYTAVIYVTIHNVLFVSSDHSIVTISATMISMKLLENVNGLNLKRKKIEWLLIQKIYMFKICTQAMFNFWSYLIDSFLKLEKSVNFLGISGNTQTQTNALGMKHYACSKNLIESRLFFLIISSIGVQLN